MSLVEPQSFHNGRVLLYLGDCLNVLDALPDNSVDSVVTDPPYHLTSIVKRFGGTNAAPAKEGTDGLFSRASSGFMGKTWDGGDIAFRPELWARVLRVLKPGAYLVAFSSSRTFGRMSVAIEQTGFITHPLVGEIFDRCRSVRNFMQSLRPEQADAFAKVIDESEFGGMLTWIFGSGFPKAHRVMASGLSELDRVTGGWEGWRYGAQSLKPALEPIYMGQKPFSEGTGTANIRLMRGRCSVARLMGGGSDLQTNGSIGCRANTVPEPTDRTDRNEEVAP